MSDSNDKIETSLTSSFVESCKGDAYNACIDISDVALKYLSEDSKILDSIPLVKGVVSIYNLGKSVSNLFYIKKIIKFLNEFNNDLLSREEVNEHILPLLIDSAKREKEIEYILILLDRCLSEEKTIYIGQLYIAYLFKIIDLNSFMEYSQIINQLLISDIKLLQSFQENWFKEEVIPSNYIRLQSYGLIRSYKNTDYSYDENSGELSIETPYPLFKITDFGLTLKQILNAKKGTWEKF